MDQPHVTTAPMPSPEPDVTDTTHIGGSRTFTVIATDGRAYTIHRNHMTRTWAGWHGTPVAGAASFAPSDLTVYDHQGGAATAEVVLADMPEYPAAALRWALGQVGMATGAE